MKVLVIGAGGREHAILNSLFKSPQKPQLFCAPGNAGTAQLGQNLNISALDIPGVVATCKEQGIDYVVVAPDDPLCMGMVDALQEAGIAAFGPTKAAARIEGSKVFSKELMKRYHIPSARYEVFSEYKAAVDYVVAQNSYPTVIKADGLALGKGVIIAEDQAAAVAALSDIMVSRVFGESGSRVVIEEFLTGPEVSVLSFCDGKTLVPMVSSMDHKRAFDGNTGPNTGGMGTIAPNPHYTKEIADRCMDEIFLPTLRAMEKEGCPFSGCLYFGLMLTKDGPKVIEYNCRFGDPETQVVLPLLESDLLEVMQAVSAGRLHELEVRFSGGAAACVVLASGGYPGNYKKGLPIQGLSQLPTGVFAAHAGTALQNDCCVTNGGRVLGVCATGEDLQSALKGSYNGAQAISFEGMFYRKDIGQYGKE